MKHFTLSIISLFISTASLWAQKVDNNDGQGGPIIIVDGPDEFIGRSGLLLEGGLTTFRPWHLNSLMQNNVGFTSLLTLGISSNESEETHTDGEDTYLGNDFTYALHWFLPQTATANSAGGRIENYRLKGWELMTSSIAWNMIPNENFDFVFGVGAYWGNLKLTREDAAIAGKQHYTNPFVAPMFRSELRFNYSFLSAGFRFSYRYDITDPKWKRKDDNLETLPAYSFREMQYLFYIGFRFSDEPDTEVSDSQ